jgi:hypothetical protein
MQASLDPNKAAPATTKAVIALEDYVQKSGLDPRLMGDRTRLDSLPSLFATAIVPSRRTPTKRGDM